MLIAQLKQDLKLDEGLKLKPYHCTADKLTIGIGRNLADVGISEDEAMILLENDIKSAYGALDRNVKWWRKMHEPAQRALCNMCFNLGITRLLKFKKMLSALERGDYHTAADEALNSKWAKQVGSRADRIANLIRKGGD